MKPMMEAINVAMHTSFKVETYGNAHSCETMGWHIHPEYELVFVKNGSGVIHIGTHKHNYSNGALIFLGGNVPHADFGNKDYSDSMEIVVQFKKEFVEEKLKVFPELDRIKTLIEKSNQVLLFDQEIKDSLQESFIRFEKLDDQDRLINFLKILNHLSRNIPKKSLFENYRLKNFKTSEIRRLEEIFEYVNINYAQHISIGAVSAGVGLTANSFCRFFKKMTQRTFIGFVNEYRIGKAIEFFQENNTNISEAMYGTGFNDPSYFARQFKKYKGVSPSEYLQNRYG